MSLSGLAAQSDNIEKDRFALEEGIKAVQSWKEISPDPEAERQLALLLSFRQMLDEASGESSSEE